MVSAEKREGADWPSGEVDGQHQSTKRESSGNECRSMGESAHQRTQADTQEPLPSYDDRSSPPSRVVSSSTASSLRASQMSTQSPTSMPDLPFTFPTEGPPPYTPSRSIDRLCAIPQTHSSQTAPLLSAYPPALSAHGITQQSWLSFLRTISAILTATPSKRLLAQASDITASVPKKLGKDLLSTTTTARKNLGHSAKHLNPFGVLGSAIGFTVGVTGAVVGSVFGAPGTMATASRTSLERAEAYLTAANGKWLHGRGLHVALLGLPDVAVRAGSTPQQILEVAMAARAGGSFRQMAALRPWVGEMVVGQLDEGQGKGQCDGRKRGVSDDVKMVKDQRSFARGASSVGFNVTGNLSVEGSDEVEATGSSEGRDVAEVLEFGPNTMWLVVTRWEEDAAR